jgi:cystathionine beta-lyase/cystathionine gamma-synthase
LTLAATAYLKSGDHVLLSRFLYGKTTQLIAVELSRFGITASEVDACDLEKVRQAITPTTRMLIVETISNPQLRVADIASLSTITGDNDVILLVDNTFATPIVCRPLSLGADLVLESISKFMNGHGDLMLGLLCGRQNIGDHSSWNKIDSTASTWGLASSPFDCWLAERGLATLPIRMQTAAGNAMQLADHLERVPSITNVQFPGLTQHPDHQLCRRQFASIENQTCFANMLTFELRGQRAAAEKFIRQAENIPFCPSLGEMSTTLSHPASTSHRLLNSSELKQLGISEGTIRLSVGLESIAYLQSSVNEAVAGLDS